MSKIFFLSIILSVQDCWGQSNQTVSVFDFVKIKNDKTREAIFFYENNWKLYRDIALQKNYIVSYKIVAVNPDSLANFHLILITEYADSIAYAQSEERFTGIIKETRPNGPLLLNELKPQDFRENIYYRRAETLFTSGRKD